MTWATGKPARGFTLIELLLVLTLLAVVLAVALPSLTGFLKTLSTETERGCGKKLIAANSPIGD